MATIKQRILIADDEPSNVRYLGELLKDRYELIVADDGEKAALLAKNKLPDLILLDVMMPRVDGYSACRMIKEDPVTAGIPIIFITAKNEEDDIVHGFESGGQDYIVKPFNPLELNARIKTQLEFKNARERLREDAIRLEEMNSRLAEALQQMENMARIDPLTGIANRRYLLERLAEEAARSRRHETCFAIAIADIDDFKSINDTHGHECGDLALKTIATVIKNNMRMEDIVSRWGGEEFLMVFPETTAANALVIAEKLRGLIDSTSLEYDSCIIRVTITIGVAVYDTGLNIDENIRRADLAMYRGKRSFKNIVILS